MLYAINAYMCAYVHITSTLESIYFSSGTSKLKLIQIISLKGGFERRSFLMGEIQ